MSTIMDIAAVLETLRGELPEGVELVAVSKTYPPDVVRQAYDAGQRVFGENRPQELKAKYEALPKDIRWHMIGHLQTNKVKYIAPFVEMIHSVDSLRLMEIIEKEAVKNGRVIDVLLEVYIAQEDSKSGWDARELEEAVESGAFGAFPHVRVRGLMGIASLTDDRERIRREFEGLRDLFGTLRAKFGTDFDRLSMGMTSDYRIAVECGSNMVRIGSMIFGARDYSL